jgi:hypothetical protein
VTALTINRLAERDVGAMIDRVVGNKLLSPNVLEALVSQVAALSRLNPLLMIFEDAHWTDPTGLELFNRIADKVPSLRVLLIVTFRPEFDPPWIGRRWCHDRPRRR